MTTTPLTPAQTAVLTRRVTSLSVATAVVLVAAKTAAWLASGSVALLASLADSGLDLLASLITLYAVRYAVAALSREERPARVGELGEGMGLSTRRLLDLFEREVGLSPKLFSRLCRFQRAADRIWRGRGAPAEASGWADMAADCGFADQSHLIREFREFSGVTPAGYAARLGHHRNHIPL